jgi:hypothetical protein
LRRVHFVSDKIAHKEQERPMDTRDVDRVDKRHFHSYDLKPEESGISDAIIPAVRAGPS